MKERPLRRDSQKPLSESKIQKQILDYLETRCWPVKVMTCNKNGTPDIICCVNGRFVAFEVKTPKGRPTKLQLHRMKEIHKHNGAAFIVRSVEDVKEALEEYING
jgi:Holliday junction resolvase